VNKPKGILSLTRDMFDYCYNPGDQEELQSLLQLVGGIPSQAEYTREWLLQHIKEAELCITGWESIPLDAEVLNKAKKLRLLFHTAGTVRGLYDEAARRGLRMTSNASINAIPVAEFALGMILAGLKGVFQYQESFCRRGKAAWNRDLTYSPGYYGTTVGIIGLGYVGYRLVKLLGNFEFQVVVYSNHLEEDEARRLKVRKLTLEKLMVQSDVVVVCAPNLPGYRHLINAERLALMKDNALLINVARGALVEEEALIQELKKGRITACLDVTNPEPPEEKSPFYRLPNCILTPHIAGSFGVECHRLGKATLNEVKRYLRGEPLSNEFFPDELSYRG